VKCRRMGIVSAMRAVMRIVEREGAISEERRPCASDPAIVELQARVEKSPIVCVVGCSVFGRVRLRIRCQR